MASGLTETGFDESVKFLKTLPDKINRRILVSSMRKAARPFVAAIKARTPVATRSQKEFWGQQRRINPGLLKKSVGVITAKQRNTNFVSVYVGPKRLKSAMRGKVKTGSENRNDPWYRHFVIRGTAGFVMKTGKNKGRYMPGQPANPIVDQAYAQVGTQVGNNIEKNITDSVKAHCKRNGVKFISN